MSSRIQPTLAARVWGGTRLRTLVPGAGEAMRASREPIGEAWFGDADESRRGVLVKLLDVHERLSVQLHPDNTLAAELHGPGAIGKHEAWVILDASPDATLLLGRDPSVAASDVAAAVAAGRGVEQLLARIPVVAGDVLDVPPGLLHALLPDILVWEVQQPTERTYRVADWGRGDPTRPLHRTESARALNPDALGRVDAHLNWSTPGEQRLLRTPHFDIHAIVGPFTGAITGELHHAGDTIATHVTQPGVADAIAPVRLRDLELAAWSSAHLADVAEVVVPAGSTLLIAIGR